MTKAANRATAKTYISGREQQLQQEQRQKRLAVDLEVLGVMRGYLRHNSNPGSDTLISAIDDYVERLTGDRTKLHTQGHGIP
jgi:hypothetical protein